MADRLNGMEIAIPAARREPDDTPAFNDAMIEPFARQAAIPA
jgi:hypothetical protein